MKYYERYRAQLRWPALPIWDNTRLWGKRLVSGDWTYYRLDELQRFGRLKWPLKHLIGMVDSEIIIEGWCGGDKWEAVSRWWIDEKRRVAEVAAATGRRGDEYGGEATYDWLIGKIRRAVREAPGEIGLDQLAYHVFKHEAILNKDRVADILQEFGWEGLTGADLTEPLKRGARRLRGLSCYLCLDLTSSYSPPR